MHINYNMQLLKCSFKTCTSFYHKITSKILSFQENKSFFPRCSFWSKKEKRSTFLTTKSLYCRQQDSAASSTALDLFCRQRSVHCYLPMFSNYCNYKVPKLSRFCQSSVRAPLAACVWWCTRKLGTSEDR